MSAFIALLRGINVGGKNLVKMADLTRMFVDLGFGDPKTLLQSGNVVFSSEEPSPSALEELLESETVSRLGVSPSFMVRSATEWDEIIRANPFAQEAIDDPSHLVVVCMKHSVDAAQAEAVRGALRGPEKFQVVGRHMYVSYPEGIGTSKLGTTPGWNKLTSTGTARNWNTVLKLGEIVRAMQDD